jgi:hypothetical protein
MEELSPIRLREITNRMVDAVTSPQFIEAMRAVRAAPEDRRLVEASRRLAPDALRAAGVPLPNGVRISSRYFEQGREPVECGDWPDGRANVLNFLNEVQPGLMDRLRTEAPEVFRQLSAPATISGSAGPTARPVAGCCGAGGGSVCGCCGG